MLLMISFICVNPLWVLLVFIDLFLPDLLRDLVFFLILSTCNVHENVYIAHEKFSKFNKVPDEIYQTCTTKNYP